MAQDAEPDLSVLLEDYRAAVFAKDVEGFVSLYDEKVVVFDLWNEWSCEGIAAWRGLVLKWFSSMGENRDVVEFDQVQKLGEQDLATVHAFVSFRCVNPEGKELRSIRERLTWSLLRQGVKWRIVHQHTSVPVDFKTFKILFGDH